MQPAALARACAEAMWAEDEASRGLGMELSEVAPGRAEMAMTVTGGMVNGHKTCHGGYIFTLADSAFAFACNSYNQRTTGVVGYDEEVHLAVPGQGFARWPASPREECGHDAQAAGESQQV